MVESVCLQGRATGRLYILLYYPSPKKKGFTIFLFNSTHICPFFTWLLLLQSFPCLSTPRHLCERFSRNKCNVGYCFLNFRTSKALVRFRDEFHGQQSASESLKWDTDPACFSWGVIWEWREKGGWKVEKWLNYVREEQKQTTIGDHLKLVIDLLHVFLIPSDVSTNLCENKTLVWTPNHLNSGTPENSLAYSRYIRIRNSW